MVSVVCQIGLVYDVFGAIYLSGVCGEGVLFFGVVLYSERDSRRWMASSLSAFVCEVAATCCFGWILPTSITKISSIIHNFYQH